MPAWDDEVAHLRRLEHMRCFHRDRAESSGDDRRAEFSARDAAALSWIFDILAASPDYADAVDRAKDIVAAEREQRGFTTRRI